MGHFYKPDGSSCHELVGKNGKLRATTIRDARQLGLVPSVTTIMDVQAKPALIRWIQNQVLEAAIASPFNDDWYIDGWKAHIIKKSREIGDKAAKRGNEIHDAMENYFRMQTNKISNNNLDLIYESTQIIENIFPGYVWYPEDSFSHPDGFGGRVDLWGRHAETGECVIIDFKTKDKNNVKDIVQYDDHCIQLAAYQIGLNLPGNTRRFNLFISVHAESPGLCKLVECIKFDKYIKIFYTLKTLWQLKNNYFPGEHNVQ